MEAVLTLEPNYIITKATNELLAKIYIDFHKIQETPKMVEFFTKKLATKTPSNIRREMAKIIGQYDGKYKSELDSKQFKTHNIIPNVLRDQLATLLTGTSVPSTFKANYVTLGNGNTTPSATDTQLASETKRGLFTNRYSSGSVAYLDKFFASTEVGGMTFLEAGIFCDGTGTANSGYLLSRILMNETMAANETLTINATITITSAT